MDTWFMIEGRTGSIFISGLASLQKIKAWFVKESLFVVIEVLLWWEISWLGLYDSNQKVEYFGEQKIAPNLPNMKSEKSNTYNH